MKIFSVGQWDWGGSGYFLSQAVTRHTPHASRAFRREHSKLEFPSDITEMSDKAFREMWEWADVIHVHDVLGMKRRMKLSPKPVVITYHGGRYRTNPDRYHRRDDRQHWLGTVATPDLTSFGLPLLQNCRPDLGDSVNPSPEFTVAHAPTNRAYKNTPDVIKACKELNVRLLLIERTPWKECVRLKGQAHVLIDQFRLGYGNNAVEAWSMGMPVISDADEEHLPLFEQLFGELPFYRPKYKLADAIDALQHDHELYDKYAQLGHHHYCMYHAPEAVAARAVTFYEQAIYNFKHRHGRSG